MGSSLAAKDGNGVVHNGRFGTLAVHAGSPHDPTTGAVIAPVSWISLHCCCDLQLTDLLDLPLHHFCADQRG